LLERCDIPQEPNTLSVQDFKRKYFNAQRAVLIRNITQGWRAASAWRSWENLTQEYGARRFFVGRRPPMVGEVEPLRNFLAYMTSDAALKDPRPLYLWDDAVAQVKYTAPSLRHPVQDTAMPNVITGLGGGLRALSAQLTVGPACTGSHMHKHNHAFCVLVHGLKYWILRPRQREGTAPPNAVRVVEEEESYHPRDFIKASATRNHRGQEWWRTRTPGLQECTQQEGDFLYVPNSDHHLVINLWPSIAVNHEFEKDGEPEVEDAEDLMEQARHDAVHHGGAQGGATAGLEAERILAGLLDQERRLRTQLEDSAPGSAAKSKAKLELQELENRIEALEDRIEALAVQSGAAAEDTEEEEREAKQCLQHRHCVLCRETGCAWCIASEECVPENRAMCQSASDEVGSSGLRQSCPTKVEQDL